MNNKLEIDKVKPKYVNDSCPVDKCEDDGEFTTD